MNTLKVLYDDTCFICSKSASYFKRFQFFNFLDLVPLSQALVESNWNFDQNFSKDKMALYDSVAQKAYYGIEAYIEIFGYKFSFLKKIRNVMLLMSILDILYSFISFNRKMIFPIPCHTSCEINPSKKYSYRIVFVVLCGILASFLAYSFFSNHVLLYNHKISYFGLLVMYFGQFSLQFIVFRTFRIPNFYDYSGQVGFLSFLGGALLWLLSIGLNTIISSDYEPNFLILLLLFIVFMFLIYEHIRRVKIGNWPLWITFSWISNFLLTFYTGQLIVKFIEQNILKISINN